MREQHSLAFSSFSKLSFSYAIDLNSSSWASNLQGEDPVIQFIFLFFFVDMIATEPLVGIMSTKNDTKTMTGERKFEHAVNNLYLVSGTRLENVKIFLWGYQPVPFNKKISFFAFYDCKLNRNHKEKVISILCLQKFFYFAFLKKNWQGFPLLRVIQR